MFEINNWVYVFMWFGEENYLSAYLHGDECLSNARTLWEKMPTCLSIRISARAFQEWKFNNFKRVCDEFSSENRSVPTSSG